MDFEEELDDLVAAALKRGESADSIISALELKRYALLEEADEE